MSGTFVPFIEYSKGGFVGRYICGKSYVAYIIASAQEHPKLMDLGIRFAKKQQKKEDEWSVHLIKKLRANIIIIDTNQYALD